MFRKRDPQQSLFSASLVLPLIDEEAFRDLYHDWNGRPNKPVQTVIGVLLLKEMVTVHTLSERP